MKTKPIDKNVEITINQIDENEFKLVYLSNQGMVVSTAIEFDHKDDKVMIRDNNLMDIMMSSIVENPRLEDSFGKV